MSPPAVKCLQSVTGSAVALGTKDCSDTRFVYILYVYGCVCYHTQHTHTRYIMCVWYRGALDTSYIHYRIRS